MSSRSLRFVLPALTLNFHPVLADDRLLPIWGKEAEARGYTLPKPFGLSLSYMDMSNPVEVKSIGLTGHPVLEALQIDAPDARFEGYNVTLRGDMWLFPFWNIYGILGYTDGHSEAPIREFGCDIELVSSIGNKLLCGTLNDLAPEVLGLPFQLELSGATYGMGTTLAGGVGNWFALVDVNYTLTNLSLIDGEITTLVAAPRIGYRWQFDGGRELRLFAGAMYQKVDQNLGGSLLNLGLPDAVNGVLERLAPDAHFQVVQSGTSPWNTVVGVQYALNRDWELLLETGFGARNTSFLSLGRRF
ncbi:hypothetical protein [Ferrimonas gelatinilytica]|uniref:Lipoprotein n=1 Tax=Ferrimonas gelatinilytica TaxID=1255257 RepID=A0ABP9S4C1_9GAMM